MSTTARIRLLLVAVVVLLAAVTASGASASPPISASGTLTYQSATFNSIRSAGGNTIIDLSATVAYTGTFSGTSTLHGTLILHPNGTANFHDVETFTGTVNGVPGTVTFNLLGKGNIVTGTYEGTQVIIGATGALAGLHGVLRQVGTVPTAAQGPLGTYTGRLQAGTP